MTSSGLPDSLLERYSRQIAISEFGIESQMKLKDSRVTVFGVGGLGSPASLYLAAAGFGYIRLVDYGFYELSNLNRQVLGWEADLGVSKVDAAARKLRAFNSDVVVEALNVRVDDSNVESLISDSSVVVDALDNWESRFVVNKACVKLRIPLVHGGVSGFSGELATILPSRGPCLRCIYPSTPVKEQVVPVFGAVAGVVGVLEALEAVKVVTGYGEPLVGKLLLINGKYMDFTTISISRNPDCPVCGG